MSAKRLFEDDDVLFPANDDDRPSQVELKVDLSKTQETAVSPEYLSRVPALVVSSRELSLLPLGHREGFLVSCIDGQSNVESILDVCAMPPEDALGILNRLVARGIVVLR